MAGSPRVGVLALQGDVREHAALLAGLGADVVLVRRPEELSSVQGLVLPGGESSVIDKLSRSFGMQEPIRAAISAGLPVYGTCAGLILLADEVLDGIEGQQSFGGMDIAVRRNAFGRQSESFETSLSVPVLGDAPVRATFIRAPIVERAGVEVEVLAALPDGGIVAVRQGPLLGTSFHPEVDGDTRFHQHFLENARAYRRSAA
ncbi:pyridoxal 5'-phosphate synthase glutaminase subunit PdxT [Microbacterium sp. 3J1]|uniref:pyridoxal 5'-phosphate synthase glutaminase subunit PdxT n=1 Tax=Microbacterium sp. 3J1 TaxID=861269 RepID=UPI000A4D5A28|nr:pyridoxal 5'-phosphate synthase glutaminase subunit PdxT [Microbacterium sp. 3J1]